MYNIKQIVRNNFFIAIVSIVFFIIILINIINFFGGIKVSKKTFFDLTQKITNIDIQNNDVHLKIGFKLKYIVKNASVKLSNYDITIDELIVEKNFLPNKPVNIIINQGDFEAINDNKQSILQILKNFGATFNNNLKVAIYFNDISLNVKNTQADSNIKIEGFKGIFRFKEEKLEFNGEFVFASSIYSINSEYFLNNGDFTFKLEEENIIFKSFIKANKGKVLFSVNNITKFLNLITPDTINLDLKQFDGSKNSFYFTSDISYNDVRRDIEFNNSKIQIFDGTEQEVKIENISNNQYKITLDVDELLILKSETYTPLNVITSAFPSLQFGSIFPDIGIIFDIQINNIKLNSKQQKSFINNFNLQGELGYGSINFDFNATVNEFANLAIKGFLYNYETPFRKGLIQFNFEGELKDEHNFNLFDLIEYKNVKNNKIVSSFDFFILGDSGILTNIQLKDNNSNIKFGKFEFNFYSQAKSYFIDLNIESFNFDNIKFIIPKTFTNSQVDLFRTLFDYLKVKDLSNIVITCQSCIFNNDEYKINFRLGVSRGKFELRQFSILNSNLDFKGNFIFDIRNLKSNLFNLNIDVGKWNNFKLNNLLVTSNLFKNLYDFKLPSLVNFSGLFNFNLNNIKGEINSLDLLNLKIRLALGEIKQSSSIIKFNGVERVDFITMQSMLNTIKPFFNVTAFIPNINVQSVLKVLLNDNKFNSITGFIDTSLSLKTEGFFMKDLLQNANVNIAAQSNSINIKDFNLENLSNFLSNPNSVFKNIKNSEIINKVKQNQDFQLSSKLNFNNMVFGVENLTLKSLSSNSTFVGKVKLLLEDKFVLQLVGRSAVSGANINNQLIGLMPLYVAIAVSNTGDKIEIKFDYSQINKYSEARRVIFE